MKIKKTLLVLCFSIVLNSLTTFSVVNAQSYEEEQYSEIFQDLNIIDNDVYTQVTKERFIKSLLAFIYENPSRIDSVEYIARNHGILDYNDVYTGNEAITITEAIKYSVNLLGYGAVVSNKNDYDEYLKKGSEIGLTKGVSVNSNKLSRKDYYRILYNIMEASPLAMKELTGKGATYVECNESLLSLNRDIEKITGIMDANLETSLYGLNGSDRYVSINEVKYLTKITDKNDLLGKNVIAYVYTGKGENEIIYLGEENGKNEEITMDGNDVLDVEENYSFLTYKTANGYKRKALLDNAIKVIYNNKFYSEYKIEDFSPKTGTIRLVDNDNNGKYNIVFIYDYETVVVQAVSLYDKKIYSQYTNTDAINCIELEDTNYNIYNNNEKCELNDIKQDDVLCVLESRDDTDKSIVIYVINSTVSGSLSGLDILDKTIIIDGEELELSSALISENSLIDSLKIGDTGTFYLDHFGRVAFVKKDMKNDYAVVLKVKENKKEDQYYITYMDLSENVYEVPFAKKVKVDDISKNSDDAYLDLENIKPQIVTITTNKNNELKEIQTAKLSSTSIEGKLVKSAQQEYYYRANMQGFGNKIYFDEGAKVVVFPQSESKCAEDYSVLSATGYFKGDVTYKFVVYDMDKFGFTKLVSLVQNTELTEANMNESMFLVTGKKECVNQDDEIVTKITGSFGIYKDFEIEGLETTTFDNVSEGDLINISVDRNGKAVKPYIKFHLANELCKEDVDSFYNKNSYISGKVKAVDAKENKIIIDSGTEHSFRLPETTFVRLYDREENTCEFISIYDISPYDDVALRVSWGLISELIVVK